MYGSNEAHLALGRLLLEALGELPQHRRHVSKPCTIATMLSGPFVE